MKLSEQQQKVAIHLSNDLTIERISKKMGVSVCTTRTHARKMRAKFGKRTVAGLMAELFRQKLIE